MENGCCLGINLHEDCDKATYCREKKRFNISKYDRQGLELITSRTSYRFKNDDEVCSHHEKVYLSRYESVQKYCNDPFKTHKKNISKGLQIPDQMVIENFGLKPGQKLFVNCMKVIKESATEQEESIHDDREDNSSNFQCPQSNIAVLNESAALLGISPIKSIGKRDRAMYGKRRAKKFKESVNDLIASTCHVSAEDLSPSNDNECKNCTDFHQLLKDIKARLKVCSRQEKLQLLTLAPQSWPIEKRAKNFRSRSIW